jgi:hypothetical protein
VRKIENFNVSSEMRTKITFIDGESASYSNELLSKLFPYFMKWSANVSGEISLDYSMKSFTDLLDNQRFASKPKSWETSALAKHLSVEIKYLKISRMSEGTESSVKVFNNMSITIYPRCLILDVLDHNFQITLGIESGVVRYGKDLITCEFAIGGPISVIDKKIISQKGSSTTFSCKMVS